MTRCRASAAALLLVLSPVGCGVKEETGPAAKEAGLGAPASPAGADGAAGVPKDAERAAPPPLKPREPGPREWYEKRVPGDPLLCYLFGARTDAMLPLGGTVLDQTKLTKKAEKVKVKKAKRAKRGARVEIEPPDPELARKVEAARQKRMQLCTLEREGPVVMTPAGVRVSDGGKLFSRYTGKVLASLIRKTGTFSVEALVTPADTRHGGPARIVGLSQDALVRNFTLGQQGARWVVRLRTSETDANGCRPELTFDGLSTKRAHLTVTYDGRAVRFYIDGGLKATRKEVRGDLREWDPSFPLVLGNEFADRRDWAGVIRFVAFYDRALSADEVRSGARDLPPGDMTEAVGPSGPGERPDEDLEVF